MISEVVTCSDTHIYKSVQTSDLANYCGVVWRRFSSARNMCDYASFAGHQAKQCPNGLHIPLELGQFRDLSSDNRRGLYHAQVVMTTFAMIDVSRRHIGRVVDEFTRVSFVTEWRHMLPLRFPAWEVQFLISWWGCVQFCELTYWSFKSSFSSGSFRFPSSRAYTRPC